MTIPSTTSAATSYSEIAAGIQRAAETRDLEFWRQLCAPGATAYNSLVDATMTMEEAINYFAAVLSVTRELTYTDVRVSPTETGYVDQHYVDIVMLDGTPVRIPAVVIVTVQDGLITHWDEYQEGIASAPVGAALAAL